MYNFLKSKRKAKFTAAYCGNSECYTKYFFVWFGLFLTYAKVVLGDLDVCSLNMMFLTKGIHTPVLLSSLSGWLAGCCYGSTRVNAKHSVHVHKQRDHALWYHLGKINSLPLNYTLNSCRELRQF